MSMRTLTLLRPKVGWKRTQSGDWRPTNPTVFDRKTLRLNKRAASNSTGLKPAYTVSVSCREAAVHNGQQFKGCDLSVMRKKLARADAVVSRRENETRKVQADMLWFACTSVGNGN